MKVRISEDGTRTTQGQKREGEVMEASVNEAIELIRSGKAEAADPFTAPDNERPFRRQNGMMKSPMVS